MARELRQLVETALYGSGDRRRYTLDSPVLSDVWAHYYRKPSVRLSLLLEPWEDTPAFTVGEHLRNRLEVSDSGLLAAVTYNRTMVIADLSLQDIVNDVLPLTGWYNDIVRDGGDAAPRLRLPTAEEVWDDLSLPERQDRSFDEEGYPFSRLLGFIRIAGLLFLKTSSPETRVDAALAALSGRSGPSADRTRSRIARMVVQGWKSAGAELSVPEGSVIYAVSRNRPAEVAIRQSVRTVKGDAAATVFSIDCSSLTWAVVDSGIDAGHEAFVDHADLSLRSRIRETYDFTELRELLTARTREQLPGRARAMMTDDRRDGMPSDALHDELLDRIRRSRQVDWELLRPFLRVASETERSRPVDPHGTHVAGILASDWRRPSDPMRGMCPTINILDLRVCRADGTSDEFIVMCALQFIRHLNANSDRMAVHGVNISLSLEHDAAVYACGRTPICDEAERTVASGVVVVAAAGNHGYRRIMSEGSQPFEQFCPVSITDPGNAENVITVGSTHRLEPHTYGISYFSSRGPTGDGRVKPDLVAPGEKIFAPTPGHGAKRLDGTSMAAPHVSGAAAMLMARHVELVGQPRRIKQILCDTATDLGREPYFQGRGLIDVLRAIQSI